MTSEIISAGHMGSCADGVGRIQLGSHRLLLFLVGVLRGNTIRATGPRTLRGKWHSERGSERDSEEPLNLRKGRI